ncbi:hypothetical protein [Nocardia sp. NPDC004604]|uniref:hypothetical protein n=1 Tax=Nocardia sp. NPDC004604 TaxID=3157013 RepID=UPI0033A649B4
MLDTLPEPARSYRLPHHDFFEMLFAAEVARRDRRSEQRRAKAAHPDPQIQLQAWDDTAVTFGPRMDSIAGRQINRGSLLA